MKKIIKNRGFMAVEILVAVSIIAISILAAMTVSQESIYVSRQAFHATQAGFLLEEGGEAVRIFRDDNTWANFMTIFNTSSTYYIPATISSWTASLPIISSGNLIDNFFTRTVTFANVNRNNTTQDISSTGTNDPGTKLVTITVSWPEGGNTITKTLQFYVMDIFL
jgi:Tfp pilus assembly protein PilV